MKLIRSPLVLPTIRIQFVYANELIHKKKNSPLDSLPLVSLHVYNFARRSIRMNQKESHLPLQYMDLRIVFEWVNRRQRRRALQGYFRAGT